MRVMRSQHLRATRPRLHERPLPEQWAVALGELDRLAVRVVALERALVQVALHTKRPQEAR